MVCIPVSYFFINSADLNDRAVLRLGAPNENIVQNHLKIALFNAF